MPPVPTVPPRVFTLDRALQDGWSPGALRYAVRIGRLQRLRGGAFRPTPGESTSIVQRRHLLADASTAASLTVSGSAVSHASAATLWGMWLYPMPAVGCLTVPPHHVGRIPHVHLHRATMEHDVVEVGGIAITSPARTALDVAREHGVEAGVVAIDSALHLGLTGVTDLCQVLRRCRGWPGSRRAFAAFEQSDGLSESALESRSRLAIARSGLPTPRLQAPLHRSDGSFIGRVDFLWDRARLVGECDGMDKYTDPAVLREEKMRQERLERIGYTVVRWTWSDLAAFDEVARRLRRHLD